MAGSATFNFPKGSTVLVQGFVNSTLPQTVIIQPPSGSNAKFSGNGSGNASLPLTTAGFLTAGSSGAWASFTAASGDYVVTMQNANGFDTLVSFQSDATLPGAGTSYFAEVAANGNAAVLVLTTWTWASS